MDFSQIYQQYLEFNPEEERIEHAEELTGAKAYMIVLTSGEQLLIGLHKIPESWKLKSDKGMMQVLFTERRFEDLADANVFSISNTIDMLFFSGRLYIYSLKSFESLLNYRERMISDAEDLYDEVEQLGIFTNMDILRTRVGNNRRYLRKIAVIQSLGYYRDKGFLKRLQQINEAKGWNIQFDNGQITFTEDTIDTVLTVLQNKRLHSELTHQDFDVPSATQVP